MFRTCEYFTPALLPQKHNVMNAKLLWIPSTKNCTRAADIQPPSLQISMLR